MKLLNYIFSLSLVFFLDCSKTTSIDKTIKSLDQLETIKYVSVLKFQEDGVELSNDTITYFFDFRRQNGVDFKYHFFDKNGSVIYDGTQTANLLEEKKELIIASKDIISPYNSVAFTLLTLKEILPLLLSDEDVQLTKKVDTLFQGKNSVEYAFTLKKKYIDWEKLDFRKEYLDEVFDTEFSIIIDKSNHFPLLIKIQNGQKGWITSSFEKMDFNYEPQAEIWDEAYYSKGYAKYSVREYLNLQTNKKKILLDKDIGEWELPNLFDDSMVSSSQLNGSVVLLEFWFKGCGSCQLAIPGFNKIYEKYKNGNFKMYGIEFLEKHSQELLQTYIEENDKKYPNLYKGKSFSKKNNVTSAPTIIIIDKTGKIVYAQSGFYENEVLKIIEQHI